MKKISEIITLIQKKKKKKEKKKKMKKKNEKKEIKWKYQWKKVGTQLPVVRARTRVLPITSGDVRAGDVTSVKHAQWSDPLDPPQMLFELYPCITVSFPITGRMIPSGLIGHQQRYRPGDSNKLKHLIYYTRSVSRITFIRYAVKRLERHNSFKQVHHRT